MAPASSEPPRPAGRDDGPGEAPSDSERDSSLTQLLDDLGRDDVSAAAEAELLPLIYDRLRRLARSQRRGWHNETMNTTALVHEAYLKLARQDETDWENRAHFFGVAAKAMRHILVDYARRKNAQKRRVSFLRRHDDERNSPGARRVAFHGAPRLDDRACLALLRHERRRR